MGKRARGVKGRLLAISCAIAIGACGETEQVEPTGGSFTGLAEADDGTPTGADDGEIKLDVADTDGALPCAEGQVCDECRPSEHEPCDGDSTDPFHAMGINCEDGAQGTVTTSGATTAIGTRTGFGSTATWAPREGERFAVIGSGVVADLDLPTPPGDTNAAPAHCNDDLGAFDLGQTLPPPLRHEEVAGDCTTDPTLLGQGDCSNSIFGQFSQGGSANDYTELRLQAVVPPNNDSLSYSFAFLSTEYPYYSDTTYNDMYVGWLESEKWTGNISFDEDGNPISLNAGFLDFRDDDADLPELGGTCMRQHAATKWLSTTAPVLPGETVTVVFAIFDLHDSNLDSYAFLDGFEWGCDGTDHPVTMPVG